MCNPVALAAGVQGASSIAGYVAETKSARALWRRFDEGRARAFAGAGHELAQLRLRQQQERESVVADLLTISDTATAALSRAAVGAAEAGVGGGASLQALLDDLMRQGLVRRAQGERELARVDAALGAEEARFRRETRERIIGAIPSTSGPSLVGLGLSLASHGLQGYVDTKIARAEGIID